MCGFSGTFQGKKVFFDVEPGDWYIEGKTVTVCVDNDRRSLEFIDDVKLSEIENTQKE